MLPKGTRDFLPEDMRRRDFIIGIIESVFQRYAFEKIETPSIELNKTLSGKYGEEGDRLMFKVLPRGRKLEEMAGKSLPELQQAVEEAMRYDLTVPFARFVVDHRNSLQFPFKRYQIQNVWRADRPQKGRFREFTQCDADVVGVAGLVQDAELMHLYDEVFRLLGLSVALHLNHRALLQSLAEKVGAADRLIPFTVALDKLDKIGWEGVRKEWEAAGIGFHQDVVTLLETDLLLNEASIKILEQHLPQGASKEKALNDLQQLQKLMEAAPLKHAVLQLDLSLARGLDYYTGCIFEVKAKDAAVGSIGGGGRYDDLTAVFGLKDTPGVGISFGLDRIQLAMEELGLLEEKMQRTSAILIANMGGEDEWEAFQLLQQLRAAGLVADLYPTAARFKKQIDFAVKTGKDYLLISGESERAKGVVNVKILASGEQREVLKNNVVPFFHTLLSKA